MEKLLLTADEAAEVLGLSRSKVFGLIQSRRLASVKIGGSRRIPATVLRDYVEELMRDVA
ncbi:MAG: helix-turn-helix domain-containing protein [Nocardioidaceae bacterium]